MVKIDTLIWICYFEGLNDAFNPNNMLGLTELKQTIFFFSYFRYKKIKNVLQTMGHFMN